jgi:uncharacterized membrane protein
VGNKKISSEKSLKLVKAGYWIMIPCILLLGLSLAFGAPDEVGKNLSILTPILIIFYLWGYLGLGKIYKDERLAKIASRAMTISWGLTLITASLLAMLRATYFSNIGGGQILGIIIVIMVSSMAVSNEIYKRKGDIDW